MLSNTPGKHQATALHYWRRTAIWVFVTIAWLLVLNAVLMIKSGPLYLLLVIPFSMAVWNMARFLINLLKQSR